MNPFLKTVCVLIGGFASTNATAELTAIDFTDLGKWGGAEGQRSFSALYEDIDLTVTATSSGWRHQDNWVLTQGNTDPVGLGVAYLGAGANRDIQAGEILSLDFDRYVDVSEIKIANLFADETLEICNWSVTYDEIGYLLIEEADSLDGGFFPATNSDGSLIIAGDWDDVKSIHFTGARIWKSDFSVAGLHVTSLPLPATSVPFAFGLGAIWLALGSKRFRQRLSRT